jgi:uncharacterized membrane protein
MNASSNSNNNIYALLTYPIPLVGVIILVSESMKNDPFLRTHAVQSIALGVALTVVTFAVSLIPFVGCLAPLLWLGLTIYYGLQANQGKTVTIPFITDFCRNQKWI